MKDKRNVLARLAAGVLVVGALTVMVLAVGEQGTQNDPLVTLSYIQDVVTPDILAQTGQQIEAREAGLTEAFSALIGEYRQEMEDKLAGAQAESSAFTVVDVPAGKTLIGGDGCELLLREGAAACLAPTEPGLIDMTDGGTLPNGGALVPNHLYMVTVGDRGFTASTDVKLLVRGSYTIR